MSKWIWFPDGGDWNLVPEDGDGYSDYIAFLAPHDYGLGWELWVANIDKSGYRYNTQVFEDLKGPLDKLQDRFMKALT